MIEDFFISSLLFVSMTSIVVGLLYLATTAIKLLGDKNDH